MSILFAHGVKHLLGLCYDLRADAVALDHTDLKNHFVLLQLLFIDHFRIPFLLMVSGLQTHPILQFLLSVVMSVYEEGFSVIQVDDIYDHHCDGHHKIHDLTCGCCTGNV